MTERRFKFYRNEEFDTPVIYDKEDEVYYFCVDLEKIGDVLNAQHEEIEQLRKEKIYAETKLYKAHEELLMRMDYDLIVKNNTELEKENRQLKKEVESKQRVINAYEQYINDLKEDGVIE